MTWTNDAPKTAGWYWWRVDEKADQEPVKVTETKAGLYVQRPQEAIDDSMGDLLGACFMCQWSSTPIPEPEEEQ